MFFNIASSYPVLGNLFINGGITIEGEPLWMQVNITNQTSLFSHPRLPWKCQHKNYHGNLLVTQPLPSTFPSSWHCARTKWLSSNMWHILKKHHLASNSFFCSSYVLIWYDGCSTILFWGRNLLFLWRSAGWMVGVSVISPWRDHSGFNCWLS